MTEITQRLSSTLADRYAIERELGQGGMAVVYAGWHEQLDRPVALKVLAAHLAGDEQFRARFHREVRVLQRVQGPCLVPLLDADPEADTPWLATPFVPGLTLEENLILAQIAPKAGWPLARIYDRFPRLAERRHQEGVTLSGGEQQMLAIARALARDLTLLLLDEPYEGLAPMIVAEIEEILVELKNEGLTIIVVEQNALAALKVADRAVILDDGQVVFTGTAEELLANPDLRREHLAL